MNSWHDKLRDAVKRLADGSVAPYEALVRGDVRLIEGVAELIVVLYGQGQSEVDASEGELSSY
jgi:hypothetical protein